MKLHLPAILRNQIFAFSPISQIQLWADEDVSKDVANLLSPEHSIFSANNLRQILQLRYGIEGDQLRLYYDRLLVLLGPLLAFTKVAGYYGEAGFYTDFFLPQEIVLLLAVRCNDLVVLRYLLQRVDLEKLDNIYLYEAIAADLPEALAMLLAYGLRLDVITLCQKLSPRVLAVLLQFGQRKDLTILTYTEQYIETLKTGKLSKDNNYRFIASWNAAKVYYGSHFSEMVPKIENASHTSGMIRHMLGFFDLDFVKYLISTGEQVFFPFYLPKVITAEMVANAPKIAALLTNVADSPEKRMYMLELQLLQGIQLTTEQIKFVKEFEQEDGDEEVKEMIISLSAVLGLSNINKEGIIEEPFADVIYSYKAFEYNLRDELSEDECTLINAWRIGVQVPYFTSIPDFWLVRSNEDRCLSLKSSDADSYGIEGDLIRDEETSAQSFPLNAIMLTRFLDIDITIRRDAKINNVADFRLWEKYFPGQINKFLKKEYFKYYPIHPATNKVKNESWLKEGNTIYEELYKGLVRRDEKTKAEYARLVAKLEK